jgi:exonuclease SbcC
MHFYERRTARVAAFIKKNKELLVAEHARVQQLETTRQQLMQRENRATELEAQVQRLTNDLEKGRAEHMILCVQQQQLASVYAQQQQAMELVKTQHASTLHADVTYQQLTQQVSVCQQALGPQYAGNMQNIERTVRAEEEDIERNRAALLERKNSLLQQRGRLQQEHDYLVQVCEESRGYEQRIAQLERDSDEYAIIAQALGKDGIQALLIEAVVPEIEYEANELLARLSDQHARVFIESLRDLKGGGMRETLDIKIADNAGIRPYELFSGGEAFRVDFALRIAISKLLARRAGASLQTLIIDEGFGSQDEEGLGLVMETLYKIQDSFAKVIVVSHLSSMKDQFPVHFVVEKTAHGSQVRVIEQG